MGVGILSVPFALSQAGWCGLLLLWTMGIVANYTGKALVECEGRVRQMAAYRTAREVGYETIAEAALGPVGKALVSLTIYTELFGTAMLMLVLEGDNLHAILGERLFSSGPAYMVLAGAIILPTLFLANISTLAYLGVCAVAATLTVTSAVLYTLLAGAFPPGALATTQWVRPETLPLVFGIFAFVYSGHGVFPAIKGAMRRPKDFPKVLNTAFFLVGTLCTLMGVAGYYMYGAKVADLITFNLPPGFLSVTCASLILVNPIAKFALTMEPITLAVRRQLSSSGYVQHVAVRVALAVCCYSAARFVPFLAHLMSLVGAFLTMSVSILLPAILHLMLVTETPAQKAWDCAVIAVGLLCTASGSYAAAGQLLAQLGGA